MLKALAPHLIASGLAAMVGAGVGGWITKTVVTEDTRARFVMSEYAAYLHEAGHAVTIKSTSDLTSEEVKRLARANAVLRLSASENVRRLSENFFDAVRKPGCWGSTEYEDLLNAMTEEILGERMNPVNLSEAC